MSLKTTNYRREMTQPRLFFKRTLREAYWDFLFAGGVGTFFNIFCWLGEHSKKIDRPADYLMTYLPLLLLGASIIAYCCNYSILIKERHIKPKFITFMGGFLMNVVIFVLNLLLWILLKF
ncbi:MAG: hypothetical protein E7666_02590 [Ruminococcaceae bacterium]|nr:hypothetical protein [Oscillospiraceae bacterium]